MTRDDQMVADILAALTPFKGADVPKPHYQIIDRRTGAVVWNGRDNLRFVERRIWSKADGLGISPRDRHHYYVKSVTGKLAVVK